MFQKYIEWARVHNQQWEKPEVKPDDEIAEEKKEE
jgi:hypothetical protein